MTLLKVLFEDNHLLAVVKPAGILTQGDSTGDEPLLDLCKAYIKEKYGKPGDVFLGLVHRLDRPVSGVILFARTSKAASRLSEQFRKRTTDKRYLAVLEGEVPEKTGRLIHYLRADKRRMKTFVSSEGARNVKRAELEYKLLAKENGRSLVEVKLITGYKHQIRTQLAAIGCPVVGDFKYDCRQKPAECQRLAEGRAIALHARSLEIIHPTLKETVRIEAPLPEYWPFSG